MNSTTTQPNLLELAKQGNAQAIATLMNRQLQPKGITTKAVLKEGCLQIMLESAEVPNQQALFAFVRKGLTSLGAVSIERVRVYGRQTTKEVPAWSQDFELSKAQPFSLNAQVETQKPQVEKQKEQPDKIESAKQVRASSVKKGKISFRPVSQVSKNSTQSAIFSKTINFVQNKAHKKVLFGVGIGLALAGIWIGVRILNSAHRSDATLSNQSQSDLNPLPFVQSQPSENERIALNALQKLNSRLEVGINLIDYSREIAETKFAVEQVGDSKAAELMQGAVKGHLLALQYWRCDLENEGYDDDARCRDALLPEIFAKYPVIQEKAQPVIDKSDSTYHSSALDNKVILKLIWMNVNVEILEAETKIRLGQR